LEIYLKETATRQLRQKKENVRTRNRGAATVAGAEWPKARKFGGSPTLVEEDEGLAWWWTDTGKVAERQLEGRLAGAVWPKARQDGVSTTVAGGSRGFLAGSCGERRKRQRRETVAVAVAARETVAVAAREQRAHWSGRNLQREMEEQRARGR